MAVSWLKEKGVEFDDQMRITKMTDEGRAFIRQSNVPEFVAYFALGAEYHSVLDLSVGYKLIAKCSIPLLFVISMQPRFNEYLRRKALTWIR